MEYIYRYDIAAIVVSFSILVSLIRNKTIHTRMVNTFEIWFMTIILSSVFDILSIFFLMDPTIAPPAVQYIVNIGYHATFLFIPQIFFYSIYFSTEDNKIPERWKRLVFCIPYFFILIMLILTPFTKLIFYLDENLAYHRGKFFVFTYVEAGFYIAGCIYRSIRYRKAFSSFQLFAVCFYMVFSIITLIIQFFMPELMIMNFAIAVSAMIGYLSLENPSDYLDKEMPMYNRNGFMEYMNHYLYKKKDITILCLQIVGFKAMENAIGMKNKLALLNRLGNAMLLVSPKNRNFRISQSRYAILLDDDPDKQQRQIKDIISYSLRAFKINNEKLLINVKSVIIKCPEDANNVDDILELMENSFEKTLTKRDSLVPRADKSILLKRYNEHFILDKIKTAITSGDFDVYYQPAYNRKSGKYTCAAALVRIKASDELIVQPDDFLPITEKSGMMIKIGEYVLESVCRFIVDKKPYEHGIDFIIIKLSILQCMQQDLSERILTILDLYKVNPKYIRFEVSESSTLLAKEVLLSNMLELNKHGVHFCLNDFGVGLSNIANIVKFPIEGIKIDKSMITAAFEEERAAIILKENIAMIKDMELSVIAECVENDKHNVFLHSLDFDYIQGYDCGLPMTTSAFTDFISS